MNERYVGSNEAYEELRAAILLLAVSDYSTALLKAPNSESHKNTALSLERWFLSSWGQMLSGGNGQLIIDKVREKPHIQNRRKTRDLEREQAILKDRASGMKLRVIADKYGISCKRVQNIIYECAKRERRKQK